MMRIGDRVMRIGSLLHFELSHYAVLNDNGAS